MSNLLPKLVGELGKKQFVLISGQTTKTFYNSADINAYTGLFPIYNDKGEIVEYMNVMGKFCAEQNSLSEYLYRYVAYEKYSASILRTNYCTYFMSALLKFPSKYLVDKEVLDFVLPKRRESLNIYTIINCLFHFSKKSDIEYIVKRFYRKN